MDAQELNRLWQSYQLRVTDEIVRSPEVLFCNGSAIGTLGNFSASTGKAKSKKTFNVSAILAAALTNGEVLRYIADDGVDGQVSDTHPYRSAPQQER